MSRIVVPAALALGSNLGNRHKYLEQARTALAEDVLMEMRASAIYETKPWLGMDQPLYLNQVVVGLTEWKPAALLHYAKSLEVILGRKHGVRFGPREIDIDLLVWDEMVVKQPDLELPHPRMCERDFVLVPLKEVWPSWVHPGTHESIDVLLRKVEVPSRCMSTEAPRA